VYQTYTYSSICSQTQQRNSSRKTKIIEKIHSTFDQGERKPKKETMTTPLASKSSPTDNNMDRTLQTASTPTPTPSSSQNNGPHSQSQPNDQLQPQHPQVHGLSLTPLTQCTHYSTPLDIIAIRHFCCNKFYACIRCHNALESSNYPTNTHTNTNKTTPPPPTAPAPHPATVWPLSRRNEKAVLCGACKRLLTIGEYLGCGSVCTGCGAGFNPGCRGHWGGYFEM